MTTVNEIRAETDRLRTAHFHALADRLAQAQSLARRIVEARKRAEMHGQVYDEYLRIFAEAKDQGTIEAAWKMMEEASEKHHATDAEMARLGEELIELLAGKE